VNVIISVVYVCVEFYVFDHPIPLSYMQPILPMFTLNFCLIVAVDELLLMKPDVTQG